VSTKVYSTNRIWINVHKYSIGLAVKYTLYTASYKLFWINTFSAYLYNIQKWDDLEKKERENEYVYDFPNRVCSYNAK